MNKLGPREKKEVEVKVMQLAPTPPPIPVHKNSLANGSDRASGVTRHPRFFVPQSGSIPRKAGFGDGNFLPGVCNAQDGSEEVPPRRKPWVRGCVCHGPMSTTVLQQQRWRKAGAFLPETQAASGTGLGIQTFGAGSGNPFSGAVFWEGEEQRWPPKLRLLMTRNDFLSRKKSSDLDATGSSEIPHLLPLSQRKSNSLLLHKSRAELGGI